MGFQEYTLVVPFYHRKLGTKSNLYLGFKHNCFMRNEINFGFLTKMFAKI